MGVALARYVCMHTYVHSISRACLHDILGKVRDKESAVVCTVEP